MNDPLPKEALTDFELALIRQAIRSLVNGLGAESVVIVLSRHDICEAIPGGPNAVIGENVVARLRQSFAADGSTTLHRDE